MNDHVAHGEATTQNDTTSTFDFSALPDWFIAVVEWVHLRNSDDLAKIDQELICQECGRHLCDAEDDNSLAVLIRSALDHAPQCPNQLGIPYGQRKVTAPAGTSRNPE